MYVDLHIHTDCSDGTWDIDELIAQIIDHNISLFSITDHDSIENSRRMLDNMGTYQQYQGQYIIGAEISCTYNEKLYHITAYAFDPNNKALLRLLEGNRQSMHTYNDATIKSLAKVVPEIEYATYEAYCHNRKRGGWKSLNFLIDEGIVQNVSEFFQFIKDLDNPLVFDAPVNVIKIIREAGGFPFLAHPSAYFQGERMPDEELKKWIEFGIEGIECYSSYSSLQDTREYVKFCQKHNLQISAGSDCHGTFIPERKLANPKITLDMLSLGFL